ncbi:MAG: FAD-binding oxidoreductase [Candidatus Schekmanbacteria bacterium]|nr:FAD-binding oxidoreductase [Candidatus Schekmanbacteria bacterium]
MPAKNLNPAKVDYIKPLEDKPYKEVVAEKQNYNAELKKKLSAIVGDQNVKNDPETIARYSKDRSLEPEGRPTFVVHPRNTDEVVKLVKLANETLLPLIPASSGTHNYGCTIPRIGGVIVDLSGWKQIFKVDYRNRATRIQPGVNYNELQEALEKEGLRAMMPLLPRKDQSVLTAHLEAHPMAVAEFVYSEPMYTAEIIMPKGDIFRTGSAAPAPPELMDTTKDIGTDLVGPWGPGFDWNRLYTRAQGTLGIITWANIMAEPLPVKERIYFTSFDCIKEASNFTQKVLRKWIGYECFVLNRANLAAILADNMPDDFQSLKRNLPKYVQVFVIGGLKRRPEERIAYQEADFLDTAQDFGVRPTLDIKGAAKAAPFFAKNLRRCWDKEVYWKEAYKGGSSDIFFLTTLDRTVDFVDVMKAEANRLDYPASDIGIYVQPIETGRVAYVEFSIPFNPNDADECAQVKKLHEAASEAMYTEGALYTRAYGKWAQIVHGRNTIQYKTAKTLKDYLDPNNVMNPGKLGF